MVLAGARAAYAPYAARCVALLACLPLASCAQTSSSVDRASIADALEQRVDHTPPLSIDDTLPLPPGVELVDGLTDDEAVAIALWNSLDFAAELARIEVARAQVAEAGLLRDPSFTWLFPLGPKQAEWTLNLPLEALWLRGDRVEAAERDAQALAERIVAHGLDLVQAVRTDYAAAQLAKERAELARARADLLARLVEFERARLELGDGEPATVEAAVLAATTASDVVEQRRYEASRAAQRLAARIGLETSLPCPPLAARASAVLELTSTDEELVECALAHRPEVRAAELGIEATARRLGIARAEAWRVAALVDANENGSEGFEVGPGLSLTLPLFGSTEAAHRRISAELDVAAAEYRAVRRRVANEVRAARSEFDEALRSAARWRDALRPAALSLADAARRSHALGEIAAAGELRAELAILDADEHLAEARARAAIASTDLARAVGRDVPFEGKRQP